MRFAFRQLLRTPGFTIVAVAMLALGIGANTAIFSLINAFFLRGLPVSRPEELVALYMLDERNAGTMPLSHPNYLDYREHNTVFSGLAAHWHLGVRYTEDGATNSLGGEIVSGNFFDVLGVSATLGRTFHPEEYATEDTHPVVVVSHNFWLNSLGGRTDVVGRTLLFNNIPFTVIGVAPAGFRGVSVINSPNFWVTTSHQRTMLIGLQNEFFHSRRAVSFGVVGRLKPGISLTQADAALAPISQELARRYPQDNGGRSLRLFTIEQAGLNPNSRADFARAGTLLISLTGIVLLIACANLANLLLARAAARQREITLRIALGASRARVVRELLLESALLTTLGAVAGTLLAFWLKDLLWALRPAGFPADFTISIDGRVLGFTLAVSVVTGVLFGLAPAWASTRVDLIGVLKRGSAGSSVRFPLFGFRNLLVAAQIALSVVALVIAGLFIRSLHNAQTVNPGWNAKNLVVVSSDLASSGYGDTRGLEYHERAVARLRTIPGVVDVSVASKHFFTGVNPRRTIRPQGSPDEKLRTHGELMSYLCMMPGHFRFLGIPLVAGRDFAPTDDQNQPIRIIVNETFARRAWPDEEAVGKQVKLFGSDSLVEVIGVVRDSHYHTLSNDPIPFTFFAYKQIYHQNAVFHVRTAGDPAALVTTIQKELRTLDPGVTFFGARTMDDQLGFVLWGPRTGARLMSAFGALGLLLAGLGVYAIMAHAVTQRTREIGIRLAIGAQARDVVDLVIRRGLVVSLLGLCIGLLLAIFVTRHFQNFIPHVSYGDPLTLALVAGTLLLSAIVACLLPALRATRVDPLTALRSE